MFSKFTLAAFLDQHVEICGLPRKKSVYLAALNHVSARSLPGGLVSITLDDNDVVFQSYVRGIHHFYISPTFDISAHCDCSPTSPF